MPSNRTLAWINCGIAGFSVLPLMAMSYVPQPGRVPPWLFVLGLPIALSIGFTALAIYLGRVGSEHWLQRAGWLHLLLVVLAIFFTMSFLAG